MKTQIGYRYQRKILLLNLKKAFKVFHALFGALIPKRNCENYKITKKDRENILLNIFKDYTEKFIFEDDFKDEVKDLNHYDAKYGFKKMRRMSDENIYIYKSNKIIATYIRPRKNEFVTNTTDVLIKRGFKIV